MLVMISMRQSMSRAPASHSLDRLDVLRAVVEAGSFVGAGEALGLTQPAVSRAVSKLEERIGVRLFRRSARSIALTEEGRAYYEAIAPHLRAIEEATNQAGAAKARVRGTLRVNVDPGTAQFVLVPHLEALFEQHPELRLELVVRDRLGDLAREGFDAAVRVGHPKPSALKARLLLKTRVLTCASPAYLARRGTPRRPADVAQHRCILMRDPVRSGPFPWELVRGKKVVPLDANGPLIVNQFGPMLAACLAGQGIAQFLDFHVESLLAEGKLVRLFPDWADETYPLYAYHHGAQHPSAKVRAFLDFVVSVTRR
jgi:DNA-binding transcriptional LysR family regulator